MTLRRYTILLAAGSSLGALAAGPAAAEANAADDSSAATATEDASSFGVGEITVTAQRRDQNMQDVPISVTAVGSETLGDLGIRSTSDLGTVAPAVTFSVGLGGGAPTIRGVGGTGAGTDESANALYLDGVYMPTPQSMVFQFNNIERVEVLKGPQGTLFGRNASGGLIQVITSTPSHEPTAKVELGYSNYDTIHAAGSVSTGLSDSIAFSLSGVYDDQQNGWGKNVTTGQDAYKGRFYGGHAKLVWDIGPNTKVTAAALYAYTRAAGIQGGQIFPGEVLYGTGGGTIGFYDQTMNTPGLTSNTDRNYSLSVNHDLGWASVNSITSRDVSKSRLVIDADLGPVNRLIVDLKGPKKSWTQEFQLASPSGSAVQWLIGAFYYHGAWYQAPSLVRGSLVAPLEYTANNSRQVTDSYAAYGQTTVPVTDTTNITLGLRYTIDKRKHDVTKSTSNPATAPTIYPTEHTKDKKLTWRFAVDQKLGDQVMAYASYSRGFKSGLYNIGNPGNPPVKPQVIDAYEIGLKSDFLDRRVRLNLSAFHYDLKDVQLRTIVAPNPTPIFYNAAKEKADGVDAEINVAVTSRFSIMANVAYLSAHYDSFPGAIYYSVNAGKAPYTAPGTYGLKQLPLQDGSGQVAVYSPKWVTNLSGQYEIPTSIGSFTLAGIWNYNDGFYFDPQNRTANPSYNQVNSTLTWKSERGFFVRAYVNNILKEKYYSTVQASNFGDYYFPAPPRTYGVSIGADF